MTPKHEPKHEKEPKKGESKEALKKLGFIFLGILLAVNTIQLVHFGDIVERVDRYNQGVVDELGGFRSDITSFGGDLNEIRSFLLLPTKEYSFLPKEVETGETQEQQSSRTETALYTFMEQATDEASATQNKDKAIALATSIHDDATFTQGISTNSLSLGKVETNDLASSFKVNDTAGNGIFAVNVDLRHAAVSVQSALGTHEVKASDASSAGKELIAYFNENKEQAVKMKTLINDEKEAMKGLKENADVKKILADKRATIEEAEESDDAITYPIFNNDKEKVLAIEILRKDGSIQFADKTYKTVAELLQPFMDTLKATDFATAQEQLINSRKAELEAIFKESTFQEMLKNSNWTLVSTPREDYNKLLYDVKDSGNKVVFSFAIEMSSGALKIIKDDQELDLFSFMSEGSKKKP